MSKREDVLNREEFENNVINLIENLSNDKKGCMFAIDGKWGIGKSFVLEDIEEELESIQCEETNSDKYLVFHYNCWQYDYYEEPAVAIVSAMLDKANENVSAKVGQVSLSIWKKTKRSLNSVAREMVKNKVGIDLVQVANDVANGISTENRSKYSFDKLFAFKKTLDDTKKKISEMAQDRTIVIVVDELDRCIPNYAIKVLERLHHFFEGIDNVIVVFAIESNQLNHSIEEMFGQGTDTEKYLKKFMSFKLKLEYGEPQQNIWDKYSYFFDMYEDKFFSGKDIELTKEIVVELFKHTKIDIREKEKIIDKINTIHRLIGEEKQDYSVMLFEMIVYFFMAEQQRFQKSIGKTIDYKHENLDFLAKIRTEGFVQKNVIDGQYIFALQKIENKSKFGYTQSIFEKNRELLICKNAISLSFFYIKKLYIDSESEYPTSEIEKYGEELAFCDKFDKYRKLIQ